MRIQSPIALTLGDELIYEGTTYAYQYQASNGEFIFQCPQSGMVHQETVAGIERAVGEKRYRPGSRSPKVTPTGKPTAFMKTMQEYPKKYQDIAYNRMDYVRAIILAGNPSPQRHTWPKVIEEVAAGKGETPHPWTTVRTWFNDFMEHGRDIRALIPQYWLRGANFKVLCDEQEDLIAMVIETYKRSTRTRVSMIIKQVQDEVRKAKNEDSRKKHWPIPGATMIRRRIKDLCPYEVAVARFGKKAADDTYRMAKQGEIAKRRLDRVELDHTIANVQIYDEENKILLGTPTFGASMDRRTRMLLGCYIGFKRPSEFTLMQTMRDMILPKDYIHEEFPEIKNRWKAYGKPVLLVVDNAYENHGPALRNAGAALGIDVRFAKVRNPEFKGMIERFFHTMEVQGMSWATGRTFKHYIERGVIEEKPEYCMTLREFRLYIYDWIINHYCSAWHRGINAAPADMWDQEVKEMPIRISDIDVEQIDEVLGRVGLYKVNKRGIRIEGLTYQSRELHSIMMLPEKEHEVSVTRFHENVGYIDVRHPRSGALIRVPCNLPEANNQTIDQNRAIQRIGRERGLAYMNREEYVSARVESYRRADEIYQRRGSKNSEKRAAVYAKGGSNVIQPRTKLAATSKVAEIDILAETSVMPSGTTGNLGVQPDNGDDVYKTGDDL